MKALVLTAALLAGPVGAETYRFATVGEYGRWISRGADGALIGFEADLLDRICPDGHDCVLVVMSFPQLIPAVASGQVDAAISAIAPTAERSRSVFFTEAYYRNQTDATLFARAGITSPPIASARIGIVAQSVHETIIEREGLTGIAFASPRDVAGALVAGTIDYGLFNSRDPLLALSPQDTWVEVAAFPLPSAEAAIAVSPHRPELHAALEAALAEMKENGDLNELLIDWFGFEEGHF